MTFGDDDMAGLQAATLAASDRTACPSSELLARVAAGGGRAAERRAVADHLGGCRACSEDYRVAASLGPWAGKAAAGLDFVEAPRASRAWIAFQPGYALAAAGMIAVVALAAWGLWLRAENTKLAARLEDAARQRPIPEATPVGGDAKAPARVAEQARELEALRARLNEALAPDLNVPVIDLEPADALRGRPRPPVRISGASRLVTLVLTTETEPAAVAHDIEITDASGSVVWRHSGLVPNADKAFTLTIPRSLLPAGVCRLRLYAVRNEQRRMVGEYSVLAQS